MVQKSRKQKEAETKNVAQNPPSSVSVKREFSFSLSELQGAHSKASIEKKHDKSRTSPSSGLSSSDLWKSIILSGLIFSLELVIYWARSKYVL